MGYGVRAFPARWCAILMYAYQATTNFYDPYYGAQPQGAVYSDSQCAT